MNEYVNEKIERVLNSLDGIQQAEAPNFFHTRLKAKMEKKLLQQPSGFVARRPVVILSALLLLLAFNITFLLPAKQYNNETEAQTVNQKADLESFMAAYNIQTTE